MTSQAFKEDLLRRIKETKTTRWVRFGIVALIFLAWVAWLNNWWFALFIFLLFDIYITGYIPFTWWKKSKSKVVRTVMSWVDAIVYALVLVYFIFAFVGQNYMIPSSSLEKTLLTGDYLWVNKLTYGPRVPITPIHFPLVHNTIPILNCKSYLEWPQNSYRRLPGLRSVENGDIVVFNFPAGDTVALKYEESPLYYQKLVQQYGWRRVNTDKAEFGDVIYRPVDRRVNFVKRVVGLPGDNFRISNDTIYINGVAQPFPQHVQFGYIAAFRSPISPQLAEELGITPTDYHLIPAEARAQFDMLLGVAPETYVYDIFLTQDMINTLRANGMLLAAVKISDMNPDIANTEMYPLGNAYGWSISNWGGENGVVIPKKGMTMPINATTWALYNRVIRNYENHPEASFENGQFYIGGEPANSYTFAMDYYFMMGDNRHNSQDSRFWGFVPEDHIVGTPSFVIISFDKEYGGVRWDRVLTDANPDK